MQLPVHCNIGLAVGSMESTAEVFLKAPASVASPDVPKSWTHPGFSKDPRQVVANAARARNVISRQVASSVCQEEAELSDAVSILSHTSRLVSKWEVTGYTLRPDQVCADLCARGPVVAALPVHANLLAHISSLMGGADTNTALDTKPSASELQLGLVAVVILGWQNESTWKVALPWGKFTKTSGGEHAWDGTVHVARDLVVNACAVIQSEHTSSTSSATHTMRVKIMPNEWNPPTTRPLPVNTCNLEEVPKHGKMKQLKNAPPQARKVNLRDLLTDDNAFLAIKCGVTCTIVVLAILSIVMFKSRKH